MEFKSTSGAEVVINTAPFQKAIALKSAFAKEFASADIDIDFTKLKKAFTDTKTKLQDKEIDTNPILKVLCLMDSSPAVYKAMFDCLIRCTYNGEKITEATFEDEKAREDYYEILLACAKVNLSPFFKGLVSKLSGFASQALNSIPK